MNKDFKNYVIRWWLYCQNFAWFSLTTRLPWLGWSPDILSVDPTKTSDYNYIALHVITSYFLHFRLILSLRANDPSVTCQVSHFKQKNNFLSTTTTDRSLAGRRWKCSYNIENLITLDIRRRLEEGESPVTSDQQCRISISRRAIRCQAGYFRPFS